MTTHKERVAFKLMAPDARQVFLVGSFNNWSLDADPMKQNRSGLWKKEKKLAPGTYEYKFIVDGVWLLDPECRETAPNAHGTANNVLAVKSGTTAAARRQAYLAKIKSKLDAWNKEIDRLEAKAEQAKDTSKAKYRKQIETLKSMRAEFEPKLEELRRSGGQAWEETKEGIENAWKALSKAIKSAASRFK